MELMFLIVGFLFAAFITINVIVLFVRIAKYPKNKHAFIRDITGGFKRAFTGRASHCPPWTNSGMAVCKKTGKVIEQNEISDVAVSDGK